MDRYLGGVRDATPFSRTPSKAQTPYDHLLRSVVQEGRLTPKTRRSRILQVDVERMGVAKRLFEDVRDRTMIDVSTWLRDTSELVREPEMIQTEKILDVPQIEVFNPL